MLISEKPFHNVLFKKIRFFYKKGCAVKEIIAIFVRFYIIV